MTRTKRSRQLQPFGERVTPERARFDEFELVSIDGTPSEDGLDKSGNPHSKTPPGYRTQRRVPAYAAMHRRGQLTDRQFDAAHEFNAAFEAQHKSPEKMRMERVDGGGDPHLAQAKRIEAGIMAGRLLAVVPWRHRQLVQWVCGYGWSIGAYAAGRKHQRASRALRHALDAMADELGLKR